MPDAAPSKIGTSVSILGWVVALCSLILNYVNYLDAKNAKEKEEKRAPVYATTLSTYDTANLPPDILKISQPIRHEFTVDHRSGKSVSDLVATFATKDKEIVGIDLTEGNSGATTTIDASKHEATLRKTELLPGQQIKRFITTQGITKLTLATGAKEGTTFESDVGPAHPPKSFRSDWWIFLFLGFVALLATILVYIAVQHMASIGFNFKTGYESTPILLLLLVIGVIPRFFDFLTLSNLFYGFMVYILITRFKLIHNALEHLASQKPAAIANQDEPPLT